jgi:adenylate cyclase
MDPAQLMDWVNTYMDAMTQLVEQYGGVVDDYAGDGIKANFGVPVARTDEHEIAADAANAVRCALAMSRELERLDVSWQAQHMPTARMRIGITTGEVVVGSLGSANRLKYTSVGDTVNTAARLESFDKEAFEREVDSSTCRILISGETWRRVQGRFRVEELGAHALRGRGQSTEIYRVLDEVREGPDEEAER